jgi:6-pyruvoyltetrahydropterin/6-carboxytetrahydropterin synthase
MARAYLTRRVRFTATHRYGVSEWSDEKNIEVFGTAARHSAHSHDYVCTVTVAGSMQRVSGFVMSLDDLDTILETEVTKRFSGLSINTEVAEFSDGTLAPSGENLSRFIFERVSTKLPAGVDVVDVTIAEDDSLSSSYRGEE